MKKTKILFSCFLGLLLFSFYSCKQETKVNESESNAHIDLVTSVDSSDVIVSESLIDKVAYPTEGLPDFYKNFASAMVIPESIPKQSNDELRVILSFVVEKDGSFSEIKVARDPGFGVGDVAIQTLKTMPKWNPAIVNNKPVRSQFSLPITINLK